MAMTEDFLPLPVPESLSATYLVPTSAPPANSPADAVAALGERLTGPVSDLARQMLDGSLMTVVTQSVATLPPPPAELLAAFGATTDQLKRFDAADHFVVVNATYRPGWPPVHDWAARAVSAALAEQVGADILDVFALQFLDPDTALRSLPDRTGRVRLVDWMLVTYSAGETGLWFTTKGLRRFGLLELQSNHVPPQFARAWGAVINGAARRLLRTWTDGLAGPEPPAFVPIPSWITVTGHDVAVAYGAADQHDSGGTVTLHLTLDPATDPEADSFLTLSPPVDYPGSPGEYVADACAALFGAAEQEIRYARPSDEMAQAVDTARAGLTVIRDRFLGEELPPNAQLLVKYGLPAEDGQEFVWAYVTSWFSPDHIFAASASDARCDPTVRVGRPVLIDTAEVVDWAVWVDGRGVVEGGWTDAALAD